MAEQLRTGRDLFGAEHPEVRLPEELTSAVTADAVSYTHLTLPTILRSCRSRWSPYH